MNVHIRHIEQNDIEAVSAVHYNAVRAVFGKDYDERALEAITPGQFAANWNNRLESVQNPMYVALERDKVCGFVLFGAYRDKDSSPEEGEIYTLYTDPANNNEYLLLTLLETALSHLSFMGYQRFYIWAAEKDIALIKLLTDYQFAPDGRTRIEKQDGLVLTSRHFVKNLYHYGPDGEIDEADDILRL